VLDTQQESVQRKSSFFDDSEHYKLPFVVTVPMHREITAQTAFSLEKAMLAGLPFAWMPQSGDALIGRARSIAATWFLENSPAEYLIMIDSDIVFEPIDMARLMKSLQSGYDLIGGTYTVRGGMFLSHYGDGATIILGGDEPIRPIKFLSTGFMGISKRLLQKMVDELDMPLCHEDMSLFRCYPFFENYAWYFEDEKKWIYISEDWDFCEKARKVGIEPYLDTSILLGHTGNKVWTLDDLPKERIHFVRPLDNSQADERGEVNENTTS
jgi:hypothetical protein